MLWVAVSVFGWYSVRRYVCVLDVHFRRDRLRQFADNRRASHRRRHRPTRLVSFRFSEMFQPMASLKLSPRYYSSSYMYSASLGGTAPGDTTPSSE